ncbi:MAG: hypothetical protein UZ18_ATM001002075 [Armatimonadetes bacterium OLB18]|nr:MAG: hypothetical protein UZ18_ATM001002075 [Armatimonadetes bacterium OLB18]
MTIMVLPWSTRRCRTPSRFRTSSKCRPVVGSSRLYTVRPVERLESSSASFTLCASPPESVVAGWPSLSERVEIPIIGDKAQPHVQQRRHLVSESRLVGTVDLRDRASRCSGSPGFALREELDLLCETSERT